MAEAVRVQKAPTSKGQPLEMLATLCYYFPQYTLKQARALPFKHVLLLINTARKMKYQEYHHLTQIAAAPHSKKGAGVKKLLSEYAKGSS